VNEPRARALPFVLPVMLAVLAWLALAGSCGGGGAGATRPDAAAGAGGSAGASAAGSGGSAAGASAGAAGASAGTTGSQAGAGGAAGGGGAGAGGAIAGGGGAGASGGGGAAAGSAGGGGMAGGGAAGSGQAGTGGAVTSGTGGGVFVMCDDHADFNGRGLCSPTAKFGAVVARQTLSAGGALTTLTASFGSSKPDADPGCTQEAAGTGCAAVTCPASGAKNPAGPEAGPITAKSNGGTIVTKPDATGAYDVAGLASALWTMPKAALTFAAAGGALPAFSETFCGPVSAVITAPAAAPGAGLTIDGASDLAVQWTGGAVGDLEIVLRDEAAAAGSTVEVRCFFTGASGQGTVPRAALAKIGAGTHAVASFIWVRKIGGAGGTCVELTGVNTNVSAGGAPWNGTATFR
jgi:hypothetical protein